MPNRPSPWQAELLRRHQLPPSYLGYAQQWFNPLAQVLAEHQNGAGRPVLVAFNGCQGSGKTTLCDYLRVALEADYGLRAIALSLDDFYLTHDQRQSLAQLVHPLLVTRGVPGTHDMALLRCTLDALLLPGHPGPVALPRFDKAVDDRFPQAGWEELVGGFDLVLLEGWCLGARAQDAEALVDPVNTLERDEDPDGRWRAYVNSVLERDFAPLYKRVDQWVMLQAPSFACVYRWRMEQEQKLPAPVAGAGASRIMDALQLSRFIQHYERLTAHCLEHLPEQVDHLYTLDEQRRVSSYRRHRGADS